ncbi:MAG TPA: hypothetical protein PLP23_00555 [Panacibacter sp.]|nr:hypothetical protein [Panacibacter sp.]
MYKEHLLNNIEKEMNVCRRLYTKIPPGQMDYKPGEGVRTTLELLQYLSIAGTLMPDYWLQENDTDFGAFYGSKIAASKTITHEQFLNAMDEQLIIIKNLFGHLSEDDLLQKEVTYPWSGAKAPLGEAMIATSVKWLAAYKLQLFLYIKLCGNKQLATADAWMLTDL